MKNKILTSILISCITLAAATTQPCYAAEEQHVGEHSEEHTQTAEDPDHHAEPAPEETASIQEGQGTLSPPSESEGGSVFGSSASSETAGTDEKLQGVLSNLALPAGNGTWSVYVCDLVNNTEGAIQDARMQAASLIKLYIMGAVYENYDSIIAQYGQSSVDSNLYSMITVSDNDAANTLVTYLGGGDSSAGMTVVNDFCSEKGYSSTHMGRLLLATNSMTIIIHRFRIADIFSKRFTREARNLMHMHRQNSIYLQHRPEETRFRHRCRPGVSIANKTGELSDVENDAGIIYNSSNDLIIVFMSENVLQPGTAQSTIASLSRQIYDSYSS